MSAQAESCTSSAPRPGTVRPTETKGPTESSSYGSPALPSVSVAVPPPPPVSSSGQPKPERVQHQSFFSLDQPSTAPAVQSKMAACVVVVTFVVFVVSFSSLLVVVAAVVEDAAASSSDFVSEVLVLCVDRNVVVDTVVAVVVVVVVVSGATMSFQCSKLRPFLNSSSVTCWLSSVSNFANANSACVWFSGGAKWATASVKVVRSTPPGLSAPTAADLRWSTLSLSQSCAGMRSGRMGSSPPRLCLNSPRLMGIGFAE
mmetsp:Transcript_29256/g.74419  ORF Transcript_29256/g.74419 Transcript_29256/m.74419 type:complete len:258 (+) Transcript_29256:456-1229(+)